MFGKTQYTNICLIQISKQCEWNYNGRGYEAQILAGPAWVAVFTITGLLIGFASDRIRESAFGRHRLMAFGFFVFSISLLLMGCSQYYWQLVLLRMGIAVGMLTLSSTNQSNNIHCIGYNHLVMT